MENASTREAFLQRLGPADQLFELFNLVPELSFFAKDHLGRFVALNRRGCQYCGVTHESDAIGRTDHDFFPQPIADQYHADDLAVMETGEAIINRVESEPEPTGSPRLVMTSKVPLRDSRGQVIGVAGFSRKIERTRQNSGAADEFAGAITYLHNHYEQNITSTELAKLAKLSISQFERRFRSAFNTSPRQYLMRVRVEKASQMLVESNDTVSQVAHACGFYDHAHFSRSFRRIMNMSPSDYRSQHSNA